MLLIIGGLSVVGIGIAIAILASLRVVVSTNAMHIVQSTKHTISYGKDQTAGNVYYKWPSWLPGVGVRVIVLPVSVFSVTLDGYAAYDKGRVPFLIDIMAFFRITDSNMAAQRVSSEKELEGQLHGILQGVCRTILANSEIEEILAGRSQFGKMFTDEVDENLKQWGVQSVKQIELMDIKDANNSKVIDNIMAKKKSLIEKESRVAVAENMRAAAVAEVEANRQVQLSQQEAQEQVGIRTAEKAQKVGIAEQTAQQAVQQANAATAEKVMAVQRVNTVRTAEIQRDAQVVAADQLRQTLVIKADAQKQTAIIDAEGEKAKITLVAEGTLSQAQLNAKGIQVEGDAKGAAETAILLAPVTAQLTLAKEIGSNEKYQTYLVSVRTIEKEQAVGIAQAEALKAADIKVIANTGEVIGGVKGVMDLFSSKGGTAIGSALEALKQTPAGREVMERLVGNGHG